ncbi:MAG: hypothetical protein JWQ71_1352 [Pedosphaera sp.]|nr:hypothetical protein [Pedosphaera sp.]
MDSDTNTNSGNFANVLTNSWWLLALRGIAAVLFGVLAFIWPGITLLTLTLLFGAYALAHGILALVMAFKWSKGGRHSRGLLFEGIVSIAAGIIAFLWPGITTLTLLFLIAAWAIVNGVLEIVAAIRLRKVIRGEWLLILAGILSLIFGLVILAQPIVGALAVVWWIGSFAIVFGALLIGLAFRARRWAPERSAAATTT